MLILLFLFAYVYTQPTTSDSCLVFNNDDSICVECIEGFYLQSYFCVPCSPLCKCKSSLNYCDECVTYTIDKQLDIRLSSYRDGDRCRFCNTSIPNCLTCDGAFNCTKCFNGFYTTPQGMCSNQTCIPNCEFCQNDHTCSICALGYAIGIGGGCYQQNCTDNCIICDQNLSCYTCDYSYYAQNGTCSLCMDDCLICNDSDSCQLCTPGFYYVNNTCYNTTLSNCVHYNGTYSNPLCLVCQPNYYISGGSCNQCQGCLLCTQSFICLSQCMSGNVEFNYACIAAGESGGYVIWVLFLLLNVFIF